MNQTKTKQLEIAEAAAKLGELDRLFWYAERNTGGKISTVLLEDKTLPVIPVVTDPDLYQQKDWKEWYKLSRLIAELLCKDAGAPVKHIYPAMTSIDELTNHDIKYEVWTR